MTQQRWKHPINKYGGRSRAHCDHASSAWTARSCELRPPSSAQCTTTEILVILMKCTAAVAVLLGACAKVIYLSWLWESIRGGALPTGRSTDGAIKAEL